MPSDIDVRKPQAGAIVKSDYGDDAAGGFENQTTADKAIPFLFVLQDGSPQLKSKSDKYVPGAKAGMMMNSITGELFDPDTGAIVIPCLTDHNFVEWIPRNEGGGFVGVHPINAQIVADARSRATKRNDLKTKDGHQLVETFYIYGLLFKPKVDLRQGFTASIADLIDLNSPGSPVLIPFSSTKITPYKQVNTNIGMFKLPDLPFPQNQPPIWAFPLWFTTTLEQRDQGDSYNYRIKFAGGEQITKDRLLPRFVEPGVECAAYAAARALKQAVAAGTVKVDMSKQGGADAADGGGGGSGEKDIPF